MGGAGIPERDGLVAETVASGVSVLAVFIDLPDPVGPCGAEPYPDSLPELSGDS